MKDLKIFKQEKGVSKIILVISIIAASIIGGESIKLIKNFNGKPIDKGDNTIDTLNKAGATFDDGTFLTWDELVEGKDKSKYGYR